MPNLHAQYYHGNVKAFRQELEGTAGPGVGGGGAKGGIGPGSASGGKSWTMSALSSLPVKADPNEKDQFGRTVLHLAASSSTQHAYTFFTILLRHQHTSVNLQDQESGYTALHRALFAGNIRAARDLLMRNDIDPSIHDSEGLTAFDLYNGTLDGTNPVQDAEGTDLYVWGVNRNFTLGTGDSSDKSFPDRISLLTQSQASGRADPLERFNHVGVKDVVMSKLHTGVITAEQRGNLSVCGFGSNGRLGRTIHSQLALTPLPELPHTIVGIALAQDHTLALASGGFILSWGHNRFSQLGYPFDAVEKPTLGSKDEQEVQVSPKRVVGPLKKEWVRGVAAGRMSSACWTADAVWTWGTNAGHLGYEKASTPVQVLPRKVTAISQPVVDVALSDYAMVCLLDSYEIMCFHHEANYRINFTTPRILSDAFPFRPPQSTLKPMIRKVTSCGQTFAALSSDGDVFTFSLPNPLEDVSKEPRDRHVTVKPQLIWALRKRFTAVKDMALGSDGTVIICTGSGHVFVRQRAKASGGLKFKRIPFLQRVVKVAVNESGAFAAIRVDARPTPIFLSGKTLEEDMFLLQPHFRRFDNQMTADDFNLDKGKRGNDDEEEDESIMSVAKDLGVAHRMCTIISRWRATDTDSLFAWSEPLLGSDLTLHVGDYAIPAHTNILCLRVPAITLLLAKKGVKRVGISVFSSPSGPSLKLSARHPLVGLLFLQYVYTDDVAAIWDARVARSIQDRFADLKIPIAQVKSDLHQLAEALDMAPLRELLSSTGKAPVSQKTLSRDMRDFFARTSMAGPSDSCDVKLVLADKEICCSSVILRARCPFFEAMFADQDWTRARLSNDALTIRMEHLKWRPMNLIFRYLHEGLEDDLFDYLHQETLDGFLDFVLEVLAAATELLLDRLVLVCSRVIGRHCNCYNAAALACEAAFYQANTLKLSIFDYISASMETMLESGLLDEMHEDVLQDLCAVIAKKQERKLPVSRTGLLVNQAVDKHRDWLAVQDLPMPRVRAPFKWKARSPTILPTDRAHQARNGRQVNSSPTASPEVGPSVGTNEDIFQMDEEHGSPVPSTGSRPTRPVTPLDISAGASAIRSGPVWKSQKVETSRVDLRSVMAETAAIKTPTKPLPSATTSRPPSAMAKSVGMPLSTPPRPTAPSTARTPSASSGPWRAVDAQKTPLSAAQTQQAPAASSSGMFPRMPGGQASPVSRRVGPSQMTTPVKPQPPAPNVQRKVSSGPAWSTTAGFAPAPLPVIVAPDSRSFSLLAIQQHERDFLHASQKRPSTRSFAEIQAEEREVEKERAQKEAFDQWWEDEQGRIAKEAGRGSANRAHGGGRAGRRKVPQRGRGGGRGGKAASVEDSGSQHNGETNTSRQGAPVATAE